MKIVETLCDVHYGGLDARAQIFMHDNATMVSRYNGEKKIAWTKHFVESNKNNLCSLMLLLRQIQQQKSVHWGVKVKHLTVSTKTAVVFGFSEDENSELVQTTRQSMNRYENGSDSRLKQVLSLYFFYLYSDDWLFLSIYTTWLIYLHSWASRRLLIVLFLLPKFLFFFWASPLVLDLYIYLLYFGYCCLYFSNVFEIFIRTTNALISDSLWYLNRFWSEALSSWGWFVDFPQC